MTAAELIATMRARGAALQLDDAGQLVIELEDGAPRPTPEQKRLLAEMKSEIITYLSGTNWSKVSLYQLDQVLEIVTPWSDTPLVLAPGCKLAADLRSRDPRPGRVWCTCEVLDLLLSGVRPEDARKVAEAKLAMGGAVVGARRLEQRQ